MIIVMGVILVLAHLFWRRDAKRAVLEWCAENSIAMDETTFEFTMGRPARVGVAGTQGEERYWFMFTLHGGFFSLPSSVFQAWGRVVLQDRYLID